MTISKERVINKPIIQIIFVCLSLNTEKNIIIGRLIKPNKMCLRVK